MAGRQGKTRPDVNCRGMGRKTSEHVTPLPRVLPEHQWRVGYPFRTPEEADVNKKTFHFKSYLHDS